MSKDYIRDLQKIITRYSTDKEFQLELCNYFIDELEEKSYYLYIKRAEIYTDMQEYKRAIREYRLAIDSIKDDDFIFGQKSYAYDKLSSLYYELGDCDKAINEAKKAVDVHPGGWIHVSYSNSWDGDVPLEYSKDFAESNLAELYYKFGDYKNALTTLNKLEHPLDSDKILLIKIFINQKDYSKAKKQIDKLDETSNKYVLLAEIEKSKGKDENAFSFYQKAEKVEIDFGEYNGEYIYKQIGKYYESKGNFDDALKYYKKIIDYSNNSIILADYYFRQKDYKNAIVYYLEQLNKPYGINFIYRQGYVHHRLGLSYINLGNEVFAKKHFIKSYELNPNNNEYRKIAEKYTDIKLADKNKFIDYLSSETSTKRDIKYIIRDIIDVLLEEYEEIPQEIEEYLEKLSGCKNMDEMIDEVPISDIIHDFNICICKNFQFTNTKLNEYFNELKICNNK